jgi:hypothetical protein
MLAKDAMCLGQRTFSHSTRVVVRASQVSFTCSLSLNSQSDDANKESQVTMLTVDFVTGVEPSQVLRGPDVLHSWPLGMEFFAAQEESEVESSSREGHTCGGTENWGLAELGKQLLDTL